ncbi:MAG TPA: DUF1646 family protein [Candidatus Binataceae bacterium]|nr:DUF1646 family protein [Candidatus Binataceae bacterium]
MKEPVALVLIAMLLIGPLAVRWIEHNFEIYCFALGCAAIVLAGRLSLVVVAEAAKEPVWITLAVIVAGIVFRSVRVPLDRVFARVRKRVSRAVLTTASVFAIAMLSSAITAIIAALVLVEVIGMLQLERPQREQIAVVGCFAIGMGAALTPLGGPLSTLASTAMDMQFFGLFKLLAVWVIPAVVALSLMAGYIGRGAYHRGAEGPHVRETIAKALIQGAEVFAFIAGVVMISHAFREIAAEYIQPLSASTLFFGNTVSAIVDNATLVALEIRGMPPERARSAILALLIAGGMLIPGNIPNIICAGAMKIRSSRWATIGIPIGLAMLGIYFAALRFVS